ncbi:ABC transporter ATP-binding protein [Nonomuraea sp. NPDC051191]|uniref:ABC transporter ATP-binding protein n=1 Tax=Nonomuraea sp. NPDC051191 TaxID=3364372 RepID=UPI003791B608
MSYALLVPVLRALLGSTPADAVPWLVAFGSAVALYAVLRYISDLSGMRVGTTMLRGTYHRLGEHLARLPLGWYNAARIGEVSALAGRGLLQAMGVAAHLLAPFIAALVTPLTIVAVMTAFNWRMGLAALLAAPVVAAIQAWTARATATADADRHERDQEAGGRVIEEGQRLAVVGPSGAGKSTLLQLLARFYDVDAGAVRVGGVDVRQISTETLMARIAIVFHEVYLFDGTIEENVRLGRPDAGVAEMRAAATAARLDEVIERLPGGWAANVGEGGALLSGGERQRVSIARALLKNAPIVLLDEVTSALDPVNEAAVHEGVQRLMAGRTVVMVAHRMRTVRRADRIVFLDGGRIVEEGSHDELLDRGGRYAGFWNISMASAARE